MAEKNIETKRYPIRNKENNGLLENTNDKICSVKRRKKYKLDENRALSKKLKCSENKLINVSIKKGNMIIDLSSGAYELIKAKMEQMINYILNDFKTTKTTSEDKNGEAEVDAIYKVVSQNKLTSFVVNMYHTTSRIMVNGKGIEIFKQEVFPNIMELIDVNEDQISHLDTHIRKLLNSSGNENVQVNQNSTRNLSLKSTEKVTVEENCDKIINDVRKLDINEESKSHENIDFEVSKDSHKPSKVDDERPFQHSIVVGETPHKSSIVVGETPHKHSIVVGETPHKNSKMIDEISLEVIQNATVVLDSHKS